MGKVDRQPVRLADGPQPLTDRDGGTKAVLSSSLSQNCMGHQDQIVPRTIALSLSRSDMTGLVAQPVIRKARKRAKIRMDSSAGKTQSGGMVL